MIVFHIDIMLARRKMSLTELSERVGITIANLSILKTGKAIRVTPSYGVVLFCFRVFGQPKRGGFQGAAPPHLFYHRRYHE